MQRVASGRASAPDMQGIARSHEAATTNRPGSATDRRSVVDAATPLAVAVAALVASVPLWDGRLVVGHDALEHAARTAEYARALADGVWVPRWAPSFGRGYGEPIFLFNPPLFYLLAALPTLAGLSVVAAVNAATVVLLVVGALGAYAWTLPFLGRLGALVAGVAYAWAPYVLLDVYVRQALTELTAVCLLPWALLGLARATLAPSPRGVAAGAIGVCLLLLSSTPAVVVVAPALVGQIVVFADRRRPFGLLAGLVALILGALLAAAFWVPAAIERQWLRFERLLVGGPAYTNHFLEPWQLVSSTWGYGLSVPGPLDRLGFGLGEAHLLLAATGLPLLVLAGRRSLETRQTWLAVGLALFGASMTLEPSQPLWDWRRELQYIQFPWRFLILLALGCAVLAAVPAATLGRRDRCLGLAVAALSVGLLVAAGWGRARPGELAAMPDREFSPTSLADRDRSRGTSHEYETVWTEGRPEQPPESRLAVRTGSADIADLGGTAHEQRFGVTAHRRSRLRLNTFYFPGWRVFVDGREGTVEHDNPSALMEFWVERGNQTVVAQFGPTPSRQLGAALSLAALATVAALLAWPVRPGTRSSARRSDGRALAGGNAEA